MTLGNALRRVLLSSLTGAAVITVKIDGVYHEFTYLPHMKEDITELLLNVKQLRLRSDSKYPARLTLEARGVGEVTAADIVVPPEVEIANPELHIASLDSEEARLSLEMTVEQGKGFVPGDSREGLPIGVIPVDAIFTPVRRVNFSVENTRVGQMTDYDRLVLEVWTDATIAPDEAVSEAAQILVQHLELLLDLGAKPAARLARGPAAAVGIPARAYDMAVEQLELSVRAYNCLKRAGISKVGQILEMNEEDLLGVRNFGRKSLDELQEKLAALGLWERPVAAAEEAAPEEVGPPVEEAEVEEVPAAAERELEVAGVAAAPAGLEEEPAEVEEAEAAEAPAPVFEPPAYEEAKVLEPVAVPDADEEERRQRDRARRRVRTSRRTRHEQTEEDYQE